MERRMRKRVDLVLNSLSIYAIKTDTNWYIEQAIMTIKVSIEILCFSLKTIDVLGNNLIVFGPVIYNHRHFEVIPRVNFKNIAIYKLLNILIIDNAVIPHSLHDNKSIAI